MNIPFFWPNVIDTKWFITGLSVMLVFVFCILYGSFMSMPLFHFMNWIKQLSRGVYEEPTDRHGRPVSHGKRPGTFRQPYRLYGDLILHMRQFTALLQHNHQERLQLEQTKREWIAGVTHDLKTPLSYIEGYAAMLVASDYNWQEDEKQQFIRHIQEKTTEMKQLIRDLSASLKLDESGIILSRQPGDLVDFVRQTVIDMANRPDKEQYHFSFESDVTVYSATLDYRLLQRALQNILFNAVKHNPPLTSIEVRLSCAETSVGIMIIDDGNGMDADMLEHLFDRYYKGNRETDEAIHEGLGLSIVKQLVEAHGGAIEAESRLGVGTRIHISLPISKFASC
ncbi:sensor histidine kinase [Paenibacillus glucanolyticus]|nr:HAMP domain-containing sensor histidine kinase [Paenibacillus glucanolyticus]